METEGERGTKLSVLRRKILFELSINPRFPYSTIAKNVRASPETVAYNIEKLKEKKILMGSIAVIDPKSVGCQSYELYIRLQNYSPEQMKGFIENFVSNKKIRWVATGYGHFDLMLSVICSGFDEFNSIITEIKSVLGKHLVKYIMLPLLEEAWLYSVYFLDSVEPAKFYNKVSTFKGKDDGSFQKYFVSSKPSKFESVVLDDIDKKILSSLETDSTKRLVDMAKDFDVSINTVKNRIIGLINKKVITNFFPLISYSLLGYQWHAAMLNMNIDKETEKQFLYFLTVNPNIVYYAKTIGQYNYIISIAAKDPVQYNDIMLDLRNRFYKYINDYEDILIFNQYKYVWFSNMFPLEKKPIPSSESPREIR